MRTVNTGAIVIKNGPCMSKCTYFVINLLKCLNNSVKNVPLVPFDLGGSHTGQSHACELRGGPAIFHFVPSGENSVHTTVFSVRRW